MPYNLEEYFCGIGFSGLMTGAFEKGKKGSPLAVLEVYDKKYRRLTGDKSLFDNTQNAYLKFDTQNSLIRY